MNENKIIEDEIKTTPEQIAFIEAFCSGTPCFLSARAGTGKTTTIRLAFEEARKRGIPSSDLSAIAFNKANQEDLARALGAGVKVSTLHSLGLQALRNFLPSVEINNSKLFELTKLQGLRRRQFADTMRLVSCAKNWGLLPSPRGSDNKNLFSSLFKKTLIPDTKESWEFLIAYFELFEADPVSARDILIESNSEALKKSQIDFDDMVYLPVALDLRVCGADNMVVDEAQDLSPLNLALLSRSPSTISYVGDPFQCIYTWRGAKEDTVESLGLPILPLTESFRCSGNIIKEAQRFVPDIRTGNDEGLPVIHYSHMPDFANLPPATILARQNSRLISLALKLKGQRDGKGKSPLVYILGRDFARTLKEVLEKLKGTNRVSLQDSLLGWKVKMLDKYPHKEAELSDIWKCLHLILEESDGRQGAEKALDTLFTDKAVDNAWTLSTIHKAKGKEWETVFILDWTPKSLSQPWQRKEDRNLRYVATTRAKKQLFIVEEGAQELETTKNLENFLRSA